MISRSALSTLGLLSVVGVGATSSCILLVDEAREGGAGGGQAASTATTTSTGGAGATGGGGAGTGAAGGGGAGGGAIPACEASLVPLEPASEDTLPGTYAMVLTDPSPGGVDLYLVSNTSPSQLKAMRSSDLGAGLVAESVAPFGPGTRLARHPNGGALAVDALAAAPSLGGFIMWFSYPNPANPGFLKIDGQWNDASAIPMAEAAYAAGSNYGLSRIGQVRDVTTAAQSTVVPISGGLGPFSRMVGYPGGLILGAAAGHIARCDIAGANPSACASLRRSELPSAGNGTHTIETLAYDPGRGRYIAFAGVDPADPELYTASFDETPPTDDPVPAFSLAEAPFNEAVAVAMSEHHLLVMTENAIHPCCLDSLLGDDPCGAPVSMGTPGATGGIVAAHGRRVVAQSLNSSSLTMRAFDIVDPAHPPTR